MNRGGRGRGRARARGRGRGGRNYRGRGGRAGRGRGARGRGAPGQPPRKKLCITQNTLFCTVIFNGKTLQNIDFLENRIFLYAHS